jgi:hypothetical protein
MTTNFTKILHYIQNVFFTYVSIVTIESIGGNQLSLAGFYFSLAVGGTLVLSLVDHYYEENDLLKDELSGQVNTFKKLYSKSGFPQISTQK